MGKLIEKQHIQTDLRINRKYEQCSIKEIKILVKIFPYDKLQVQMATSVSSS